MLAELLEAAVQETDVRHRLDDRLAVQGKHEAQGRVRGRMLRPEIERPEVFLVRTFRRRDGVGQFQRHGDLLFG